MTLADPNSLELLRRISDADFESVCGEFLSSAPDDDLAPATVQLLRRLRESVKAKES